MKKGKLPIVAMTANAFAEDVQLAKNTGMNGHIAKPLDMTGADSTVWMEEDDSTVDFQINECSIDALRW